MLVLINPAAGGGRAAEKWHRVEPTVRRIASEQEPMVGPLGVECTATQEEADARITRALAAGERTFVAGGGDGTVNRVLSSLMTGAPRAAASELRLGAIGLGSSNDFHKPLADRHLAGGIPLRIDVRRARTHDVGSLSYRRSDRDESRRWWIANASIGLTADANAFFNGRDGLLSILKGRWTDGAIAYSALRTLLSAGSRPLTLTLDGETEPQTEIANLAVVKNPHFAGSLRYATSPEPDGGQFDVHVLEAAPRRRLVLDLLHMSRGRFKGRTGTRSTTASRLVVNGREPFHVEFDGEVVTATEASFGLLPRRIAVCG